MKNVQIITPDEFNNLFSSKRTSEEIPSSLETENKDSDNQFATPKKKQKTTGEMISIEPLNVKTPQRKVTAPNEEEDEDISISDIRITDLTIPFVNRGKESREIGQLLLDQKSKAKGPLPILSQHFGSGKTSIVQNFRHVIQREKIELEGDVETLMKATLVEIDYLTATTISQTLSLLFKTTLEAIKRALLENDTLEETLKQKSFKFASLHPTETQESIQSIDRAKQGLAFFFEEWAYNSLAPLIIFFDESSLSESDLVQFWSYFRPLFGKAHPYCYNVFFITAGKSISLTKMGRGMIANTPVQSEHIILNMLEIKYLQELIETTTFSRKNITMKHFLKKRCGVKDMEYFTKILCEYTGGFPRLVVKVFEGFIKYIADGYKLDLSNREAISSLFNNFQTSDVFKLIRKLAEIHPITTPHLASTEIKKLYFRAVVGLPLFPDFDRSIDLIYEMNVGIENVQTTTGSSFIRVIVPKFVKLSGPSLPTRISILHSVFSNSFPISQITDKGALLEILVRDTLIFAILVKKRIQKNILWKDIDACFALSTLVSAKQVIIDEPYVKYMPKIVTTKSTKEMSIEDMMEITSPWKAELSDVNWPKIKKVFFDSNRIIHPAPKSRSSDLYFNLSPVSVLAFAIKNYPNTQLTINILQEEIDKAALAMQGKGITEIALFIFCNGIQNSVLNKYCNTNNNCLLLNSGIHKLANDSRVETLSTSFIPTYSLLRDTPKNISEYSKYSQEHSSIVHVPNGMEVIVLGEKAFNSFFSDEDRKCLDSLASLDETTDYSRIIQEYGKVIDSSLENL